MIMILKFCTISDMSLYLLRTYWRGTSRGQSSKVWSPEIRALLPHRPGELRETVWCGLGVEEKGLSRRVNYLACQIRKKTYA